MKIGIVAPDAAVFGTEYAQAEIKRTETNPQFTALKTKFDGLLEEMKELNSEIEIIAFPCNQFGGQEPGSADDIKKFTKNYEVNFPVMAKTDVNGAGTTNVYKFLKKNTNVSRIPWNFAKFLINEEGDVVEYYPPQTTVD